VIQDPAIAPTVGPVLEHEPDPARSPMQEVLRTQPRKLRKGATMVDAFLEGMPIAENLAPPPLPEGATNVDAFLSGRQIEPNLPVGLKEHAQAAGAGLVAGLAQIPQSIADASQALAGVLDPLVAGVMGKSEQEVQAARRSGLVARGSEAMRHGVEGLMPEAAKYNRGLRITGGVASFIGAMPSIAAIESAGGIKALAAAFGGGGAAHAWLAAEAEGKPAAERWQDALVAGGIDSVTAIAMGPILARAKGGADPGLWRSLAGEAGGMAGISGAQQVAHNVYEGRPALEGAGEAAAIGAGGGALVSAGVSALRRGAARRGQEPMREEAQQPQQLSRQEPGTLTEEPPSVPLTPETRDKGEAFFDPVTEEWRVRLAEPERSTGTGIVVEQEAEGTYVNAGEQLRALDEKIAAQQQAEQRAAPERAPVSTAPEQERPLQAVPEKEASAPKPPAQPPAGEPEKLVGIKNAAADAQAAFYGDEPPKHGETIVSKEKFEDAHKQLTEDPEAGKRLVSEMLDKPRPLSTEESALMSVEVVRLTNERDAAGKAFEESPTAENRARVEQAQQDYSRALEAVTVTGTKSGQAFGLRRWMLKNDYSVAELTRQQKIRNEGAPISPEQEAAIKKTHAEFQETLAKMETEAKAREERISKLEAEVSLMEAGRSVRQAAARARPRSAITERLSTAATAARERMRARLRTPHAGVDPQAIADLAIIAAEHISKGVDAAVALVKEFGDWVKPHMEAVLEQAKEYAKGASLDLIHEKIAARVKEGATLRDLRPYVRKLQEHFYREGVREIDPMVDAIHKELRKVEPKLTRREAMDLISGYGDVQPLDKSQMAAALRDQRGQLQQLAKLADMEKGLAPLKTGPERREPTAEERRLIKQVAEMKKRLGITTTDPERQLKSALDTTKTRLRNQIEDLQRQIDKREADALDRSPTPTDAEIEALKKQRDTLRGEFESIFGKHGATDAEKLAASIKTTERSIADYEQRIKAGDTAPAPQRQGPPTAEVARLQQQKAALAARRDSLRAELESLRDAEQPRTDREAKVLEKQIADLTKRIEEGLLGPKPQRQGPPTETVGRLRVQRAMLTKKLAELRKEQRPQRSPEEIATRAAIARLAQSNARMQEKMMYGDFSPKQKRQPLPRSPEYEKAVAEHERVKQEYQQRKAEEEFRSRSTARKVAHYAHEIAVALPRAIKTAWDLSAVGRQGIVFALSHPWMTATEHIPLMFKALPSEAAAREIDARIQNRPGVELGRMAKLDLTRHGETLTKGEEAIRSNWSDKIPGIAASNRAYITFLNAQRASMFDLLVGGYHGQMTPEIARVFAHAVNVGTGRGEAKSIAQAMSHAAKVLWAPKLLLSRVQMLTAEPLWRGNARTRRALAWEMYAKPLLSLSVIMALGKLAGAEIETDPRSTDFGKLRWGNSRLDITGGMLQMIVLASRTITGEKKNAAGQVVSIRGPAAKFNSGTVWDEWTGFLRKKLAPTLGSAVDVATGKNVVGEPVTPGSALADAFLPLAPKDVYESLREHGLPKGAAFGLMSIFGVGLQTYSQRGLGGAGIEELKRYRMKVQRELSKLRKVREQAANAGEDTTDIDKQIQDIMDAFEADVLRASQGSGKPEAIGASR